jgi:amino acid permease
MINPNDLSLFFVNSASGLALGLSSGILCDMLPWKWTNKHPWIMALVLVIIWAPLVSTGSDAIRRFTNGTADILFAIIFIVYIRSRQIERNNQAEE